MIVLAELLDMQRNKRVSKKLARTWHWASSSANDWFSVLSRANSVSETP